MKIIILFFSLIFLFPAKGNSVKQCDLVITKNIYDRSNNNRNKLIIREAQLTNLCSNTELQSEYINIIHPETLSTYKFEDSSEDLKAYSVYYYYTKSILYILENFPELRLPKLSIVYDSHLANLENYKEQLEYPHLILLGKIQEDLLLKTDYYIKTPLSDFLATQVGNANVVMLNNVKLGGLNLWLNPNAKTINFIRTIAASGAYFFGINYVLEGVKTIEMRVNGDEYVLDPSLVNDVLIKFALNFMFKNTLKFSSESSILNGFTDYYTAKILDKKSINGYLNKEYSGNFKMLLPIPIKYSIFDDLDPYYQSNFIFNILHYIQKKLNKNEKTCGDDLIKNAMLSITDEFKNIHSDLLKLLLNSAHVCQSPNLVKHELYQIYSKFGL